MQSLFSANIIAARTSTLRWPQDNSPFNPSFFLIKFLSFEFIFAKSSKLEVISVYLSIPVMLCLFFFLFFLNKLTFGSSVAALSWPWHPQPSNLPLLPSITSDVLTLRHSAAALASLNAELHVSPAGVLTVWTRATAVVSDRFMTRSGPKETHAIF